MGREARISHPAFLWCGPEIMLEPLLPVMQLLGHPRFTFATLAACDEFICPRSYTLTSCVH